MKPMLLPIANVPFKIGELEWVERVAVAPKEEGVEEEVLYGLNLKSERGLRLVLLINDLEPKEVLRVKTRAQAEAQRKQDEEDESVMAQEGARPKEVSIVLDRKEVENGNLGSKAEEVELNLDCGQDAYDDEDEEDVELYQLREGLGEEPELVVPPVKAGKDSRARLVSETKDDPTLENWRVLAEKGESGLVWKEGLLYKSVTTHVLEKVFLMVLPKSYRARVLKMAHDNLGHMGARRVKSVIQQNFVWPNIGQDVIGYVRACPSCQVCAKSKARKVPMMERVVMSEPFEVMAVDIVGPMPKGKGGHRFFLTAICMASRWPEALLLRSITAKAVALGILEIFSRTGIPLQLVSDQGSQFLGSVVTQLCTNLRIDRIKTTPYHPEGNGVIECMHGTLGAMLTKAAKAGQDWVGQVPFALFALRAAPNRDTQFSPFELVYGKRVRTPLDILHQGWARVEFEELETEEWAEWLVDKLEHWHDVMRERGEAASRKRKLQVDKKAVDRKLVKGDLVLVRIPGVPHKLEEAWHGPYPVLEKLNDVNYRIEVGKGRRKVVHINNVKKFWVREEEVMRVAVVAEDFSEEEDVGLKLTGICEDFDVSQVGVLKMEYPKVFSDLPGRTDLCTLKIDTGDAPPIALRPYRPPDKMREGVRQEVDRMLEMGVAEPSHSPWASPIVPVPKKDGSLRICVDYRRLNGITVADPYYMNTLEEILEKVGNSGCLSKLDLSKGFYQIGVDQEAKEKTAFITPFGKYAFNRMPFGLKNAPAVFQRMMEEVLRGCYDYSSPYIDDILVFSKNGVEHVQHLRNVLTALGENGLTIKEGKCEFGKTQIEYLGHLIGKGELAMPRHRASAMAEFLVPRTKKQLRSFLGAASYYRKFIHSFASYSSRLSPDTSKFAPGVVQWSEDKLEAFNHLKGALVNVCTLTIPSQEDCFCLHTDASGVGIGATLNVKRDGVEKPVAFFSRQLQGAQKRYSATELEGLAVFTAINFFDHFLYGRHFVVITDHQALVALLKSKKLNKRLYGWLIKLMDFNFEIIYRPGSEHGDADGLSRQAWSSAGADLGLLCEESEQQPRTAARSEVGGDVGTRPT